MEEFLSRTSLLPVDEQRLLLLLLEAFVVVVVTDVAQFDQFLHLDLLPHLFGSTS